MRPTPEQYLQRHELIDGATAPQGSTHCNQTSKCMTVARRTCSSRSKQCTRVATRPEVARHVRASCGWRIGPLGHRIIRCRRTSSLIAAVPIKDGGRWCNEITKMTLGEYNIGEEVRTRPCLGSQLDDALWPLLAGLRPKFARRIRHPITQ